MRVKDGWRACAAFKKGSAIVGVTRPMASVMMPRARLSLMPFAHLASVFDVAGATMMASAGGSTSGSPGCLYAVRTG